MKSLSSFIYFVGSIYESFNWVCLENSDLETSDLENSDLETSDLETSDRKNSDLETSDPSVKNERILGFNQSVIKTKNLHHSMT